VAVGIAGQDVEVERFFFGEAELEDVFVGAGDWVAAEDFEVGALCALVGAGMNQSDCCAEVGEIGRRPGFDKNSGLPSSLSRPAKRCPAAGGPL